VAVPSGERGDDDSWECMNAGTAAAEKTAVPNSDVRCSALLQTQAHRRPSAPAKVAGGGDVAATGRPEQREEATTDAPFAGAAVEADEIQAALNEVNVVEAAIGASAIRQVMAKAGPTSGNASLLLENSLAQLSRRVSTFSASVKALALEMRQRSSFNHFPTAMAIFICLLILAAMVFTCLLASPPQATSRRALANRSQGQSYGGQSGMGSGWQGYRGPQPPSHTGSTLRAPPAPPVRTELDRSGSQAMMPRSQASLGVPRAATPRENEMQFCPDLRVPESCECILVVPVRPLSLAPFDITDMSGNVVLRAVLKGSHTASTFSLAGGSAMSLGACGRQSSEQGRGSMPPGPSWRLLLMTASNAGQGDVLAQCCIARSSTGGGAGPPEFHLLRAQGDFFARLTQNEARDRYVLTTLSGARHRFWGSFDHHAVNIIDDAGDLMATTEACSVDFDSRGQFYRVRVAPMTDVGLVLCSLLCIGHLGYGGPNARSAPLPGRSPR